MVTCALFKQKYTQSSSETPTFLLPSTTTPPCTPEWDAKLQPVTMLHQQLLFHTCAFFLSS
jgi:hypothetical protein